VRRDRAALGDLCELDDPEQYGEIVSGRRCLLDLDREQIAKQPLE
jgi:hypothetical protein